MLWFVARSCKGWRVKSKRDLRFNTFIAHGSKCVYSRHPSSTRPKIYGTTKCVYAQRATSLAPTHPATAPPQHRPRHLQRGASIRAMTRVLIALIVITFRFLRALPLRVWSVSRSSFHFAVCFTCCVNYVAVGSNSVCVRERERASERASKQASKQACYLNNSVLCFFSLT